MYSRSSAGIPRLKDRIKHFTWAWYTIVMSTGGLSLLLGSQPHPFTGLQTIGKVVYILALTLFTLITITISLRFIFYPPTLRASLLHPTESLFFPTSLLSLAALIAGAAVYGVENCGPWLIVVLRVLFWLYTAMAFLLAVGQYTVLFASMHQTFHSMTPAWILPIFPTMLIGTVASSVSSSQPANQQLAIIVAGITFQGLGFMVSLLMYANYIGRLMVYGLPNPDLRPGMFIAVGPAGYTAVAVMGMSKSIPLAIGAFSDPNVAHEILHVVAVFLSVWLWALGFWFFCISFVACLMCAREMRFHLSWWSFVFPNVGFTISTIDIGNNLESEGIKWVASAMTIVLVVVYLYLLYCHFKAVITRDIMMQGKDEDE